MLTRGGTVKLQVRSNFDTLDFVQLVSDRMAHLGGLDEDAVHWIGVAVRESVINAITHGNQNDPGKSIFVEFETTTADGVPCLIVRVRDEGRGFDPETIASPLEPENLLKPSGRGIFLIRQFMDEVSMRRAPQGGMEVRMTKQIRRT